MSDAARGAGGASDAAAHQRNGRYVNLDGSSLPGKGSAGRMLKWQFSRRAEPTLGDCLNRPPAPITPDAERIAEPAPFQLTWLGHATWLVQIDGVTLITDPTFGRIAPLKVLKRQAPAPLPIDALPAIDVIAVSHNHYDHCDLPSIRALRARSPEALIVVPAGFAEWMRGKLGDPVVALPWWESLTHGALQIHAVPAHHWSTRGVGGTNRSHWCGFVFEGAAGRAYFAGDTGDGEHFAAIAERHRLDAAMLPIGAYSPRWFMKPQHMGPWEAVEAARTLSAHLLPMHWGTYKLTEEPLDEPPRLTRQLVEEAGDVALTMLRPGGTWTPHAVVGRFSWPEDLL